MSKFSYLLRFIFLVVIISILTFLCIISLLKLQVVDGEMYASSLDVKFTANQSIQAARGQVLDKNGVPLNTNKIVYKAIIQKAFFTVGEENNTISSLVEILKKNNEEWIDTIPISLTKPYYFTTTDENILDRFKARIGVNVDASVEDCLLALSDKFNLKAYSEEMQRYVGGIRYEMMIRDFSYNNRYTLAEDLELSTVIEIKELGFKLPGVDIVEEPMRIYNDSEIAPHIRGTIGAISAEKYDELKKDGYTLNDTIGTNGIESAMESILRGENGVRTIVRSSGKSVISDETTTPVKAGNSVKLTFDKKFQQDLQEILENQINWLHYNNDPKRGNECDAGAVVVLDVNTGALLGMATYPSYDLDSYVNNYTKVLNSKGNPTYNRAINGLYRPGSTFKSITAAAGLVTGTIDRYSKGICTGKYTFYSDYQPNCTGYHYGYNVVESLKVSCNIFFYDLGRRLGIDYLNEFSAKFGIGENLGLEIGGNSGRLTTPEIYEELLGVPWDAGATIQAAIGQSETLVTPLHLAVQAMTLANNGIRYKPYVIDSITDYDGGKVISKTEPTVVGTIDEKGTDAFGIVREGMIKVSENCVWPVYDMSKWHFDFLPYNVALKTGTPQVTENEYNSTVTGYYPAENPKIAFGIVLEKGEFSRYMVRNIIDAYFYNCYEPDLDEEGNVVSPWKRWEETKIPVR